jgi:hypothetical protein
VRAFGRGGGQVPHELLSTSGHFKELEEDVRHDREADRVAETSSRRPWRKVWSKRSR